MNNLLSRCYHLDQYIADYAREHPHITALDIVLLIQMIQKPQLNYTTDTLYFCNKCCSNNWAANAVLIDLPTYKGPICHNCYINLLQWCNEIKTIFTPIYFQALLNCYLFISCFDLDVDCQHTIIKMLL